MVQMVYFQNEHLLVREMLTHVRQHAIRQRHLLVTAVLVSVNRDVAGKFSHDPEKGNKLARNANERIRY
jgi:hypothetical protein